MRVLLRSRQTKSYYIAPNQSGASAAQAVDFANVPSAAKFTIEENLPDMEIILRYDSHDTEISLPVLAEWCLFDERALRPVAEVA